MQCMIYLFKFLIIHNGYADKYGISVFNEAISQQTKCCAPWKTKPVHLLFIHKKTDRIKLDRLLQCYLVD
jgi:hypothetical protein